MLFVNLIEINRHRAQQYSLEYVVKDKAGERIERKKLDLPRETRVLGFSSLLSLNTNLTSLVMGAPGVIGLYGRAG